MHICQTRSASDWPNVQIDQMRLTVTVVAVTVAINVLYWLNKCCVWTECRSYPKTAAAHLSLSRRWLLVWYDNRNGWRAIIGTQCHLSRSESRVQSRAEGHRETERTHHCRSTSQDVCDEDGVTVRVHWWNCPSAERHFRYSVHYVGTTTYTSTGNWVCCQDWL